MLLLKKFWACVRLGGSLHLEPGHLSSEQKEVVDTWSSDNGCKISFGEGIRRIYLVYASSIVAIEQRSWQCLRICDRFQVGDSNSFEILGTNIIASLAGHLTPCHNSGPLFLLPNNFESRKRPQEKSVQGLTVQGFATQNVSITSYCCLPQNFKHTFHDENAGFPKLGVPVWGSV